MIKPKVILIIGLVVALQACTATYRNYGYIPPEDELASIIVGIDTRDSIAETIGPPATYGVLAESSWYYMSERRRRQGPRAPEPIDRQLVAIRFDDLGVVQNIERFGLEDGQVITLSQRVTETTIRDLGIIQQLLGNFGRIDIGEILEDN